MEEKSSREMKMPFVKHHSDPKSLCGALVKLHEKKEGWRGHFEVGDVVRIVYFAGNDSWTRTRGGFHFMDEFGNFVADERSWSGFEVLAESSIQNKEWWKTLKSNDEQLYKETKQNIRRLLAK